MQPFEPDLSDARPDIDPDARIVLNDDQQALAQQHVQDLFFACKAVHESMNSSQGLNQSLANSSLRAMQYYFADLCKVLGIQTETAAEVEQRSRLMRAAHLRVHVLEQELASRSTHGVGMGLKGLEDRLRQWWETEGLGHVSEVGFHSYGCRAKLSGMISGRFMSSFSKTPASDKERREVWIKELEEAGIVLAQEHPSSRDWEVVDCDATREALQELLAKSFASGEILEIRSHKSRAGFMSLRDVDVLIRDLDEIAALPFEGLKTEED